MKKLILTVAAMAFSGTAANAIPVLVDMFHYNGHNYLLYAANGISWEEAEANAEAMGGTLAVTSTLAEVNAVFNAFIGSGFFNTNGGGSQDTEAWLGARPADGRFSTTDPTNWAWVTGETWSQEMALNFAAGEPNGDSSGLALNRFGAPTFNDEGGHVGGYIVETVPEGGSALALLGLGLCGVALLRRKMA